MSNLDRILALYRDDKRTQKLVAALRSTSTSAQAVKLNGLAGAQEAFVLAGAYLADPRPQLFIAIDKEEAAYLQNDLSGLLEKKPVRFFPDSFKRPMYFEELNTTNVLERTEAINKISSPTGSPEILVTYPEALFEKVVAPAELEKTRIEIQPGQKMDVDFTIEMLIEYGFKREDFVYEPGQFSIRGAIVDIFSYGNDYPYRIELFDEDVESIRTFDPLTQLSVQNIGRVSIVPNINTKFNQSQKVSLLNVLAPNTVIWVKDWNALEEKLQLCFEKAEEFAKSLPLMDESELGEIFRDRAFIRPHEVVEDVAKFANVRLNSSSAESTPPNWSLAAQYHSKTQPSFNKNFQLLGDNLRSNTEQCIENFIFTDNPKQIERFHAIFEDMAEAVGSVKFEPVIKAIHEGFIDLDLKVAFYTDHQIFQRHHHYRLRQGFTADKALNVKLLRELQPGDFVVHIDHGVGKYSGLEKITVNGHTQESVRIFYKNNDVLYVGINSLHKISKYSGKDGTPPVLNKLGSDTWQSLKSKAKKKVKDIAKELIKLYALRKASPGHAFPPDNYLQAELEASFIYEDTPDQEKATIDVKEDMEKPYPMDRLICGDVGFGKTEVAIRAAFKAVTDGKQVAILVPTTILALQHSKTFSDRLAQFELNIEYVNRFKSAKEKKEIFENTKLGKVDILIGTHALLSKDLKFKDLGLLVIDEEQKFGVTAKEKLRNLKVNVDTLTLTATPIPRTLQFSLMAARDLSIIRTPPPNRQPIHTEIRVLHETLIKDAIYKEIHRGGQVFFVHNRVKSLADMAGLIKRLCPDVDVATAHGQMESDHLESTLVDFIDKKYDVLVCTNIIETGLDIPNANTMIINAANEFGLSDLHQLRGRIGRSNKKAYCYLFAPPMSVLTHDARKRLKTIEEHNDLGSGFEIAMRDLDIRGAGNLLGAEQSGFIADIGYETFQRILEEAVQELKETDFKDVFKEDLEKKQSFVRDVNIDTDVEMHIPSEYVSSVSERLLLYTAIDDLQDEAELEKFSENLRDRFGPVPEPVQELFDGLRLRWIARELGFERIILKDNKLRCYFVENPQSPFYDSAAFQRVFKYLNTEGEKMQITLKKSVRSLIMARDGVRTLSGARKLLEGVRGKAMG
ncbi:MAG: transcription-repair coupling factor [Saprospiraceae bacterium]|nr:transcription-repair coupling factor [Saprospiraceae bacterium]MCF8252675.1 transcription-repair coupling factor [Saprospiraceae bacterium]MCF8314247.1 transcription-repair coupling factor [Saprospiraceae bacterium]MCF8443063.1 transcription-repair coupling factor [Saprospiraceae bacterium]